MKNKYFLSALLLAVSICLQAQEPVLNLRPSQMAKVFQRIGTTDLEIVYHSPKANGRKIFGEVVAYNEKLHGKPHPWRAGANENTLIKLGHDVRVNGKDLAAGEYGLHIFVSEREWTLAFSTYSKGWGSFDYQADKDALRVSLTPEEAPYQDWLSYAFTNPKPHAATVELRWADKRVAFDISTNVHANIIADVKGMENKSATALLTAANSVLELDPANIDEALRFTEASMTIDENFSNRMFKARLLRKLGDNKAADALKDKAIQNANAVELFSHAMSLNNEGEDTEALKILQLNEKRNPGHWYVQMGYGNYYRTHNDPRAVEHWKKALEMAPEPAKPFANYQYGYAIQKVGTQTEKQ